MLTEAHLYLCLLGEVSVRKKFVHGLQTTMKPIQSSHKYCVVTRTSLQAITSWSNAYMDWRQRTWLTTAWQSLLSPASDACGPGTGLLLVPRTRTMLGMRSFTLAGPVIPPTFARHLKAHLSG